MGIMGRLSDVKIKQLIKAGKAVAMSDGDGLTFTLSISGTASWILRYRVVGKQKEITLGRYPDLSLKGARELASLKRADTQQGKDVAREKQQQKARAASEFTLRELAEDYRAKKMPQLAASTQNQRNYHINKLILPKLGSFNARDITSDDVVSLIAGVGESKGANVAELVFTVLSEIFKHGQGRYAVSVNRCIGLSVAAIAGKAKPTRLRVQLSESELNIVFARINELGFENALVVRILLATAVRNGEVTLAEWAHVDLERQIWTIPAANIKTVRGEVAKSDSTRDFKIPLEPKVISWFAELKALAGDSKWVLPARAKSKQSAGQDEHCAQRAINAVLARFCERYSDQFRRFTPHDLRSTARSYLSALGVDEKVKERYINHAMGVYDKEDLLPERRAAMQKLLAFYDCCELGEQWNVIDLPVRRTA